MFLIIATQNIEMETLLEATQRQSAVSSHNKLVISCSPLSYLSAC
jgi:hypothetical protein